jgi:hypothetical protein
LKNKSKKKVFGRVHVDFWLSICPAGHHYRRVRYSDLVPGSTIIQLEVSLNTDVSGAVSSRPLLITLLSVDNDNQTVTYSAERVQVMMPEKGGAVEPATISFRELLSKQIILMTGTILRRTLIWGTLYIVKKPDG